MATKVLVLLEASTCAVDILAALPGRSFQCMKLQYFGHLMGRADSLEKTLMLGKIEGRRRRG